jgi:uncharacterized protein (DUF2249 family)
MTNAELIELLREVREYVEVFALAGADSPAGIASFKVDLPKDGFPRQWAVEAAPDTLGRIDAALSSHNDHDPFAATYQRAFVNGCDVQIEQERNGTWRWHVSKQRTEPHALLDSMREIARGPAATESQAKMLALEVARSAQ